MNFLICRGEAGSVLGKRREEVVIDKPLYGTVDAGKSKFVIYKSKVCVDDKQRVAVLHLFSMAYCYAILLIVACTNLLLVVMIVAL